MLLFEKKRNEWACAMCAIYKVTKKKQTLGIQKRRNEMNKGTNKGAIRNEIDREDQFTN